MNILIVGGSRNIGYYSGLRFLEAGHIVTFLLRNPSIFDNDTSIHGYITSDHAHIVKGDALVRDDVERLWADAMTRTESGVVDAVIFTVGAVVSQAKFHPIKGILISPPNLVTHALLNVLSTLPTPYIKVVTISSTGITRRSRAALPFAIRALYGYFIPAPHRDKLGSEYLISYVGGLDWDVQEYGEPVAEVLDAEGKWKETPGLPALGAVKDVLIIRPGLLTDGDSIADKASSGACMAKAKAPYRVSEDDFKAWTVSRRDVSHFVVDAVLNRWGEFTGKRVNIGY